MSAAVRKALCDIRFWIVALALVRLVGITNAPLEVSHSWRQTTVAMVARNFCDVDPNILYPRIDIGGDLSGITGMEFPLLNWLIYLMSLLFGYGHWYGRLINLVVTSVGCYYFFLLVRRFFGERHAFASSIILCVSLWFPFARKVMPDTFSMSFVLAAMYYGIDYLYHERQRVGSLVAYTLLASLGMLSKLPSGYIFVLMVLPMLDGAVPWRRKAWFVAVSAVALIPVGWWYLIWVPRLVADYGLWHFFMGESIGQGISEVWHHLGRTLYRFYDNALKYVGFVAFAAGLVMAVVRRQRLLLRLLALSFLSFLVVVFTSGETFFKHDYYVIPFVPVMAMVAGYALSLIGVRWLRVSLLVAIAAENILNSHSQFIIKADRQPLLALEQTMDSLGPRDELICINSGEEPTTMYFAHRKGWLAYNDQLADTAFVNGLADRGCSYVLVLKKVFGTEVRLPYPRVADCEAYTVYDVKK